MPREPRQPRIKERKIGTKVRQKHTFRIKARSVKGRLVFKKSRTKQPASTIKRILTREGLTLDRIT